MLTSRQKMLYAFSAIFSLLLLVIGRERITSIVGAPNGAKVQTSTLMAEFKKLPVPTGYVWLDPPQAFDKGVITGVTAHLEGSPSPQNAPAYYSHVLPSMGWKPINDERAKFCKADMVLTIEALTNQTENSYYVGIVWSKFHRSAAYCKSADKS